MLKAPAFVSWLVLAGSLCGQTVLPLNNADYSRFKYLEDFSTFTRSQDSDGSTILLSPPIEAPITWNQLVISWNIMPSPRTFQKIEACAIWPGHSTGFYSWGEWFLDDGLFQRQSIPGQKDADGEMLVDTLVLTQLANVLQIRITLGGTNAAIPDLKFLGLSFCNTRKRPELLPPNRAAWGGNFLSSSVLNNPIPAGTAGAARPRSRWCLITGALVSAARTGSLTCRKSPPA